MTEKIQSPAVVIKKLSRAEVLDFFAIIRELRDTLTKKDLAARMRLIQKIPGHHFWGALRGDEKIGFCHASISVNLSPGGKDLYLNDLVISAKSRRDGVGRRLLEAVLGFARREKCKRVLLTVRTGNLAAMKLYRQNKFERRGWARLVREL